VVLPGGHRPKPADHRPHDFRARGGWGLLGEISEERLLAGKQPFPDDVAARHASAEVVEDLRAVGRDRLRRGERVRS
jgi:hypothetical protein